jgi:uncharacterized protein (DUF362 family)
VIDIRSVAAHVARGTDYPRTPPFNPDSRYPEYDGVTGTERNVAYEAVRETFRIAGLDAERFGTPHWNPLRSLVRPGESVLLKPNLVKEDHPRDPDGWRYVMTHGSIVRAVADYVWKALEGKGRLVIADAPQSDSSFETIVRVLALDRLKAHYASLGLDVELIDLRQEEWRSVEGVVVSRRKLPGDPRGGTAFDLADSSEFVGHAGSGRYYGADYDDAFLNSHHSNGKHEYLIAGSVIQCDVLFSLPKLKTHKKAGITVSLKNLVGINADKNWLPHHTEGDPSKGGDEHPSPDRKHRAERRIVPYFRKLSLAVPGLGPWIHRMARRVGTRIFGAGEEVIRSGNWWGNETIWRMCLDLNKIALYGNPDGTFRTPLPENRRRHYVLVDGIIAGEGNGPMNPDPLPAGLIVFGLHPASVDAACAWLMGFDPGRIPIVRQAFRCRHFPLAEWDWKDVRLISDRADWNGPLPTIPDESTFHFVSHFGWKGEIERASAARSRDAAEHGGVGLVQR